MPRAAICDPAHAGLPPRLTAATGMDAIAHCMDLHGAGLQPAGRRHRAGRPRGWPPHRGAPPATTGSDREARLNMMSRQHPAPWASRKGWAACSPSHSLGGADPRLHHGTLNAVFPPAVIRFNAEAELVEPQSSARPAWPRPWAWPRRRNVAEAVRAHERSPGPAHRSRRHGRDRAPVRRRHRATPRWTTAARPTLRIAADDYRRMPRRVDVGRPPGRRARPSVAIQSIAACSQQSPLPFLLRKTATRTSRRRCGAPRQVARAAVRRFLKQLRRRRQAGRDPWSADGCLGRSLALAP